MKLPGPRSRGAVAGLEVGGDSSSVDHTFEV
jgi:hypothetical protein